MGITGFSSLNLDTARSTYQYQKKTRPHCPVCVLELSTKPEHQSFFYNATMPTTSASVQLKEELTGEAAIHNRASARSKENFRKCLRRRKQTRSAQQLFSRCIERFNFEWTHSISISQNILSLNSTVLDSGTIRPLMMHLNFITIN